LGFLLRWPTNCCSRGALLVSKSVALFYEMNFFCCSSCPFTSESCQTTRNSSAHLWLSLSLFPFSLNTRFFQPVLRLRQFSRFFPALSDIMVRHLKLPPTVGFFSVVLSSFFPNGPHGLNTFHGLSYNGTPFPGLGTPFLLDSPACSSSMATSFSAIIFLAPREPAIERVCSNRYLPFFLCSPFP